MKILNKDWEFGALGVYNYNREGKLDPLINFIRNYSQKLEGDIVEAGVFRGAQTLGIACLLKEIGSSKRVFAYDSFNGFPPVFTKFDNLKFFENLFSENKISKEHYDEVHKNAKIKSKIFQSSISAKNISNSNDFSSNSLDLLNKKIDFLGLDNIVIVNGTFDETMISTHGPDRIMAGMIDCDLYNSYWTTLKFIKTRLSAKSLVYLDEYYSLKYPGARVAVNEFLEQNSEFSLEEYKISANEFSRFYMRKHDQI